MIKKFIITFIVFLIIDGLWLTVVAKNFYAKHLGFLMSSKPNLTAAGIFYIIYIFTLIILILTPALQKGSLSTAIWTGALFGLCAYATYDLTNLATVKDWPLLITIVDLIWGTTLTATVSGISYWILSK